mmetsp:Transcript_9419/g.15230  ORF Transcript_9419/g.15230 Transcript_9419/m.15230 type:complete len:451 (-) Transcript_9419:1010-2362(-)
MEGQTQDAMDEFAKSGSQNVNTVRTSRGDTSDWNRLCRLQTVLVEPDNIVRSAGPHPTKRNMSSSSASVSRATKRILSPTPRPVNRAMDLPPSALANMMPIRRSNPAQQQFVHAPASVTTRNLMSSNDQSDLKMGSIPNISREFFASRFGSLSSREKQQMMRLALINAKENGLLESVARTHPQGPGDMETEDLPVLRRPDTARYILRRESSPASPFGLSLNQQRHQYPSPGKKEKSSSMYSQIQENQLRQKDTRIPESSYAQLSTAPHNMPRHVQLHPLSQRNGTASAVGDITPYEKLKMQMNAARQQEIMGGLRGNKASASDEDMKRYAQLKMQLEARDHEEMRLRKINLVLRAIEQKPFACPVCNERFSEMDALRNHVKTGTHNSSANANPFSLRPFVCPLCSKSFDNKYNLKRHMMIHTGEKPYGCKQCGKRFNQRSTLAQHEKRMH